MLKIKQTYHGTGGKEGYKYTVYKNNRKIGEVKDLPLNIGYETILRLDDKYYKVVDYYDDESKPYSTLETVWYVLEEYEFTQFYKLEWKK